MESNVLDIVPRIDSETEDDAYIEAMADEIERLSYERARRADTALRIAVAEYLI